MSTVPIHTFDDLLAAAAALSEQRILVALPSNRDTFEAIHAAATHLKTRFLLVGDEQTIRRAMAELMVPERAVSFHHHPGPADALNCCVDLLRKGDADIFMKGSVDTGTMMRAVFDETSGLRTGRLFSDVFLTEVPFRPGNKFLMITDGGLTPAPDLKEKIGLIANAVAVAHALGNPLPRVAILSATEQVSAALPSTMDAAILSKMNERGQIPGCLVDGPLALDNAFSMEAAREKKIESKVAGMADILVAPSIEAANALAKSTTYFAGWRLAHVIVGGKVPILIPSRADRADAKLLSIALGMLVREAAMRGAL
jgi:phosphate butyryltransferase